MIPPEDGESLHDWSKKNNLACSHCEEFDRCDRCDEPFNMDELGDDMLCAECHHCEIADWMESHNDLD
jgi:primosomal protein N'